MDDVGCTHVKCMHVGYLWRCPISLYHGTEGITVLTAPTDNIAFAMCYVLRTPERVLRFHPLRCSTESRMRQAQHDSDYMPQCVAQSVLAAQSQ